MKTAVSKQAKMPRACDFDKDFKKDWQKLSHAGRYDMKHLKAIMLQLIANDEPLGAEYKDHALKGAFEEGTRECHIGGDFLLVYRLWQSSKGIIFVAAGTHSELFR